MVEVNPSLLDQQIRLYTEELARPAGASFRDAVYGIGDGICRATVFQAMQTAAGSYGAAHRALAKLDYRLDGNHRAPFVNAYAAHIGAHLGNAVAATQGHEPAPLSLAIPPDSFDRSERGFLQLLAARQKSLVGAAQNSDHAVSVSLGFYRQLIEETGRLLRNQSYTGLLSQQSDEALTITEPHTKKRFAFRGLDVSEEAAQKSDSLEDALVWSEIGGNAEAKQMFEVLLDQLRDPEFYRSMGIQRPCGILLYGPPGTGKTAMVKAFAKESGLPYHSAKLTEILDPYHGVSERNLIRFLGQKGLLFLDELDSLGQTKTYSDLRVNENLVNLLAMKLDGLAGKPDVYLAAAVNDMGRVDPKLLRPPRFGHHIPVDYPLTVGEHAAISAIHLTRRLGRIPDPTLRAAATEGLDQAAIAQGLQDRSEQLARLDGGAPRLAGSHIEHLVETVFMNTLLAGKKAGLTRFPTTQDFLAAITDYAPERKILPSQLGRRRLQCR